MNSIDYNTTIYVTDYTRYNELHPDAKADASGVDISLTSSEIAPSFCLLNNNKHEFVGVNLERNPSLLKRDDGTTASQCECFFYARRNNEEPSWYLFLELKYCLPKNVIDNALKAIDQLADTFTFLRDNKKVLDTNKIKKPYFVISMPGVESDSPFSAFAFDQDKLLDISDRCNKAVVWITNEVEVLTPIHLRKR